MNDATVSNDSSNRKKPLLVILGPTATGKTALSLYLARRFAGEIISADSRLFYRGMDIGTAKPAAEEQQQVPHHLIDIADPDETITLGQYQDMAYAAIDEIHQRGRLPILVGGTGQYIMAVVEGWGIPRVPPNPALRRHLQTLGGDELHRWLSHLDPQAAQQIHPNNVRRVIRALEVTLLSGQTITALQEKHPPPYDIFIIGLSMEREALYRRIDERVDRMMEAGLLQELKTLAAAGYGRRLPSMSGLGYRQLWQYLEGESTLDEAIEQIKNETHRFVRHQNNWFSPHDPRIHWLDANDENLKTHAQQLITHWLPPNSRQLSAVS